MSKSLHPERGSVTLMASLFITTFIALYLHTLTKILHTDKKIRERKHAYLCFKYQLVLMKRYVYNIGHINKILRASFLLQINPKTAALAKTAHKSALLFQQSLHFKYISDRIKNPYCRKGDIFPFLLSPPYREKGLFLVRNKDGTSQVRRVQWKIVYWHKTVVLSASFGPLTALEKHLKIATQEAL